MAVQVGELYQTLELRDQDFQQGMDGAEKKSGSMIKTLGKAGLAGAVVGIGAAFGKMAKTGLDNMRELDDAAQDFQVATGASQEEVEEFSDRLQELHKVNTDSYEELGEAVTAMRQRHGEASEGMEQDFLDYAKVTGQDTAEAVEKLHAVQHSWGQDLEDQTEVMDKFKAISQDTGADIGSLQSAMAELGPVAEAVGMDFDETAAMLGHFEKVGVDANTATRGLRNAMARIEEPTKSQAKALQSLGVEVEETAEGYDVSSDALEVMMKRLSEGELSSEEMSAAMDILGRRAGVDMVNGLKDGEVGIEEMMGVIEDSEGTVESASDAYDKSLGERWTLIKRKYLHPFMETIGEGLMGVLESLLDFADKWGPKLAGVFESITNTVSRLFGEGGEAPSAFSSFAETLGSIFDTVGEIVTILAGHFETFWELFGDDVISGVTTYIDGLGIMFETVFGNIEQWLEVVAGILTGDFTRAIEGIKGVWENTWNGVRDFIDNFNLVGIVSDVFTGVTDFLFKEVPSQMLKGGGKVIEALLEGMLGELRRLPAIGNRAADWLADRLMGDSPAKVGPLSEIDKGGANIIKAWADGISSAEAVVVAVANDISLAAAYELLYHRSQFEEKWSNKYRDETETRLETLRREKEEALEEAEELGADKADIHKYYDKLIDEEREKLAEREKERQEEELQRRIDKTKKEAQLERDKWDAMNERAREYQEEQKRLDQEERQMYEDKFGFLEGHFETFFSDIMTGTKSVTDAFGNLWSSVIDSIIGKLAEMAASKAFEMAINFVTGGAGGSILSGIGSLFGGIFHQGGEIPGPIGQERMILAKAGESVSPIGSNNFSGNGGYKTANIYLNIDGKKVAQSTKQHLADTVRVHGGARY